MSHTGIPTTAQLQLLCNHTQIMEHQFYYSNYGTQPLLFQNMGYPPIQIMGHLLIQIMGHYKLLLKLWNTSEKFYPQ